MASTPATSFNSEDGCNRLAVKVTGLTLPSPEWSDCESPTDPDAREHEHHHEGGADDDSLEHAYQTIWRHFCGLPVPSCPTFRFDQKTYERLHQRLAERSGLLEHFVDNIRKDWCAGELRLRLMGTAIHEVFKDKLGQALVKELDRIAEEHPSLQPIREKIHSAGHTQLGKTSHTRPPQFDRSPDGQFRYEKTRHPHFLFEVAYSQEKKSLDTMVAEYFESTPEKFCTVLAFDIDYAYRKERRTPNHHHPVSVGLWTAEPGGDDEDYNLIDIQCLVDTTTFRDKNDNVVAGEVAIPFRLLVPFKDRHTLPDAAADAQIHLPFARLAQAISDAEGVQRAKEASLSPAPDPRPTKFRWRDRQGQITQERVQPLPKRRRTSSQSGGTLSAAQTRSASRPRRSSRLSSRSRRNSSEQV